MSKRLQKKKHFKDPKYKTHLLGFGTYCSLPNLYNGKVGWFNKAILILILFLSFNNR